MTTYKQLIKRVIADGIAEVREAYADPKDRHKRDGAIEGFEACRDKTPAELVTLWSDANKQAYPMTAQGLLDYWKHHYKALQIEFVLNVLSVGLQTPLLAHLPTARGAMKYAEIVGVHERVEGTS